MAFLGVMVNGKLQDEMPPEMLKKLKQAFYDELGLVEKKEPETNEPDDSPTVYILERI